MIGVFISHVEEDAAVALQLAAGLEQSGFPTWCYELDAVPGPSHMDQTLSAIEGCDAFVLLISPNCVQSHQVTSELTRAQDHHKPIVPLMYEISHKQLLAQRAELVERLGTGTCLTLGDEVTPAIPRVIGGLKHFNVPLREGRAIREERVRDLEAELKKYRPNEEPVSDNGAAPAIPEVTPGTMGTRSLKYPGHAHRIPEVCELVRRLLEAEGLDTQVIKDGRKRIVQGRPNFEGARFTSALKVTLGMNKAVTVVLVPNADCLEVVIGGGKWIDKAVAGTVAILAATTLPFLLFTAGWGLYKQQQLFTQIERNIGTFLAHGTRA